MEITKNNNNSMIIVFRLSYRGLKLPGIPQGITWGQNDPRFKKLGPPQKMHVSVMCELHTLYGWSRKKINTGAGGSDESLA